MPYKLENNCVKKENGETVKCHETHDEAVAHLRALQSNVKDSGIVEMSLRITKASYNKSDDNPRRWMAIDSDVEEDLYAEKMSLELYQDFERRIKENIPVPEEFKSVICEDTWCGGMPYLSIAHYKSGSEGKNVPGSVENVYIDGTRLKSKGTLHDTPLGRKVFDSLVDDLYKKKSGDSEHLPVRISIGFLDLEHKHRSDSGGQEFTFERKSLGEICPLCLQGIGGKIYTKGQLVHLAMTRVPVNPRTEMSVEKSMDITSKKQDANSIVGELADELEEKSIASDVLVVRSDEGDNTADESGQGAYSQDYVDSKIAEYVGRSQDGATVKLTVDKALLDAVQASVNKLYELNGFAKPVVEAGMAEDNVKEVVAETPVEVISAKAQAAPPEKEEDEDEEEPEGKMEKAFAALKKGVVEAKSKGQAGDAVQEINQLFAQLGQAVEQEFAPQTPSAPSAGDIAEIVRSAVAQAVQPLAMEVATLKAQLGKTPADGSVVKSKALTLSGYARPEDMLTKSLPQKPARQLTKIEELAYRSTGAIK